MVSTHSRKLNRIVHATVKLGGARARPGNADIYSLSDFCFFTKPKYQAPTIPLISIEDIAILKGLWQLVLSFGFDVN